MCNISAVYIMRRMPFLELNSVSDSHGRVNLAFKLKPMTIIRVYLLCINQMNSIKFHSLNNHCPKIFRPLQIIKRYRNHSIDFLVNSSIPHLLISACSEGFTYAVTVLCYGCLQYLDTTNIRCQSEFMRSCCLGGQLILQGRHVACSIVYKTSKRPSISIQNHHVLN